jgi:ATP-dependent DNA helicase DinG
MPPITALPPSPPHPDDAPRLLLPEAPVVVLGLRQAAWLSPDGEIERIDLAELAARLDSQAVMLCHGRAIERRLRRPLPGAYDLLELFAFVRPARFCVPTPRGLAEALGLDIPDDLDASALALVEAARALLLELMPQTGTAAAAAEVRGIAGGMARAGWPWGLPVLAALGVERETAARASSVGAFAVWRRLGEWSEHAPEPPPGNVPVEPGESRSRLAALLTGATRGPAEARPEQADYASAVTPAFAPRDLMGAPNIVLAEAGTGVGKTLGYIAPASLWAEKNQGPVWISTYTRNLQTQIDAELDRLFPDPLEKSRRVVLRKGRENYLCLLNFEEAAVAGATRRGEGAALGLMARWVGATRDGDMVGGDFPGWLVDLIGRGRSLGLADRRGECIYSACDHYHKCFIEKSVRRARRADIVVANHALVMVQAALGGLDGSALPGRYVFDEGHHVFDAADGAFSAQLSGQETADLRRWLIGAEAGGRSRARGLKRRIGDLIDAETEAAKALEDVAIAARVLPGEGWHQRIAGGQPQQAAEGFLTLVRQQVLARAHHPDAPYGIETDTRPPVDGLIEAARKLDAGLARLQLPLTALCRHLAERLDKEAEELDTPTRLRIEAAIRSLARRGDLEVGAWRGMLKDLELAPPAEFVDWLAIDRQDGVDVDIGMHRHWVDPTRPFAAAVAQPAQGILVTSATLTDGTGDVLADWEAAEARTGALHLPKPAIRARVPSPFDYPAQTRVMVVTDVRKDDMAQVAAAYRSLFLAARGGALGLFTAISRLRAVQERIAEPLDAAGLTLLAQHADGMDVGTLIDIFRAEEDACLLGTDAVRDGVDVPGRSLRLIVFDRVPWPRPDILHRARKAAFGGRRYDDMLTRLRLKQAFGRLVRRADDTGVFVLLDPMMPSRLAGAFPDGMTVERVGLAEAVRRTAEFLDGPAGDPSELSAPSSEP